MANEKIAVEETKATSKIEEAKRNVKSGYSDGYTVISLSKDLNTKDVQKDITVSTMETNDTLNRPKPSSILEALEYKSEFMRKLGMKVLTNYKEDNFTLSHSGTVFGTGASDSALTLKNNPFSTKELTAKITITRDAARKIPRGNEGAFNFNDPMASEAFKGIVSGIINKFPADFENWALNANESGGGSELLGIGDTLLYNATDTYVVGGALDQAAIRTAIKTQLDQGAATSDGLLVMAPSASFNNLKNVLGAKATALGDRTQQTGNPLIDNAEVIWTPYMPAANAIIGNVGPGRNIQGAIEDSVVVEVLKEGKNYELYVYFYVDVIALEVAKYLKLTTISES